MGCGSGSRPAENSDEHLMLSIGLEEDLETVAHYLHKGVSNGNSTSVRRAIKMKAKNYLVMKADCIGHWDFNTMYTIISERFWWPTMRMDVARFLRSFDICQKTNPPAHSGSYGKLLVSGMFHTWSIELAGPLPKTSTGLWYLLIAVEHLSRWQVAQAIPDDLFNSDGVMQFAEKDIIAPFGNLVFIVTDNDTRVSTYNPRGGPKYERMIGTLKHPIKKLVRSRNAEWDISLDILSGN